uniref:TLDc domain-containing protein n=1 Tax=Angiostrongylus cantonensis TaxID=6313 RepID=A0A0K0DLR3_ANGCA
MNELVSAGCSTASVVLLARFVEKHYPEVPSIGSQKTFMELFERILHVDQCSYAVQWLTGPSLVSTPIVRLICSSLSYYSKHVHDVGKYLRAWVDLLCVRRPALWNSDSTTLQLLGSIVHIAFMNDTNNFLGIPDIVYSLYQQMLKSWKENSHGILSMFTSDQAPPTLIANSMFEISPWATYLLLLVESKSYPTFYQFLYETLVMKEKLTVEEACKTLEVMLLSQLHIQGGNIALLVVFWILQRRNRFLVHNVWIDFIDNDRLLQEESKDEKLFSGTCHMGPKYQFIHRGSDQLSNKLYVTGAENVAREDAEFGNLVTSTKVDQTTDALMSQNRGKRDALLNDLHSGVVDKMAVTSASMEHIVRAMSALIRGFHERYKHYSYFRQLLHFCTMHLSTHGQGGQICGRSVITSSLGGVEMLFPAATAAYENTLHMLAHGFIRMQPDEQIPLMMLVLEGFPLCDALVEFKFESLDLFSAFTPECLSSTDLCGAYMRLSEAVRDPERGDRALKLLRRLGIDKAAASLPPQQFAPLIPLAFRNLASQPLSDSPLHILCLEHAVTFVFHAFPANFVTGLDLALNGCNTGETPLQLLQIFVERLGAENFEFPKTEYPLSNEKLSSYFARGCKMPELAIECALHLAQTLVDGRSRLTSFYAIWGRYMDCVTKLAQLFLFVPTREAFPPDAPSTVIQKGKTILISDVHIYNQVFLEFARVFQQILDVFSPLVVPVSSSLPPFSPSNETEAHLVLDRLVQLLTALPHNASLKPGTQNLPSLVWQFYFEKLSVLSHGSSSHYFSVIESHFVRIPWSSFHPSHRGLSAMDECLATRSPHCASFVGQVVVRVLWKDVLIHYVRFCLMSTLSSVEKEVISHYLSTLFSVLVRIGANTSNYIKVRASLLDLLKSLSDRGDWSTISPEDAEKLAKVVAVCFPHDSLTNPTDVQTMWLRTECSLVLREGPTAAPPAYNSLIADVNSIAQQHESLVTTWNAYLDANFESPLVIMSLNTLIGSLNADQVATASKVLEKTIRSYFKRMCIAKLHFCFSYGKSFIPQAAKDDSSFITSLMSSKKTAHSPRMRVIFIILELYLTQQMMGENQLPRATEGAPVLNSRINALKEVAATKVIASFRLHLNISLNSVCSIRSFYTNTIMGVCGAVLGGPWNTYGFDPRVPGSLSLPSLRRRQIGTRLIRKDSSTGSIHR